MNWKLAQSDLCVNKNRVLDKRFFSWHTVSMSEDKPRGRPRKAPDTQEGQVIHIRVGAATLKALNKEWRRRGVPSRAEVVRTILDEWARK